MGLRRGPPIGSVTKTTCHISTQGSSVSWLYLSAERPWWALTPGTPQLTAKSPAKEREAGWLVGEGGLLRLIWVLGSGGFSSRPRGAGQSFPYPGERTPHC